MATYTLSPNVKRQFLDNSGNPLASGKLYTVTAGGSYPANAATVYQTSSGTAHANPIVLDSAGRISGSSEIYLEPGQSYKFILTTSADVAVWTQDNIAAIPPDTVNVDIQGLAGQTLAAGDAVYLAVGTEGGTVAGSWYKADADASATSSGAVTIAFAVGAITSGSTGSLRLEGEITLAGPLTPGASYYVSGTAGGVTSTAPTHARFVGQAQTTTSLVIVPNPATDDIPNILFIDCMT